MSIYIWIICVFPSICGTRIDIDSAPLASLFSMQNNQHTVWWKLFIRIKIFKNLYTRTFVCAEILGANDNWTHIPMFLSELLKTERRYKFSLIITLSNFLDTEICHKLMQYINFITDSVSNYKTKLWDEFVAKLFCVILGIKLWNSFLEHRNILYKVYTYLHFPQIRWK